MKDGNNDTKLIRPEIFDNNLFISISSDGYFKKYTYYEIFFKTINNKSQY